jgi:hypothetical protein
MLPFASVVLILAQVNNSRIIAVASHDRSIPGIA